MAETTESISYKELARSDLGRYREALKDIEETKTRILKIESRINRLTQQLNPDKVQVQTNNNGPEDLLAELADTRSLYWHDCILAERICRSIEQNISNLESKLHRRILRAYWIDNKRLEQIALDENYAYRTVKKYHYQALEEYGSKL